ncbi:zinc metalloproteinase nas-38-like [Penaeus monodon]|uniref:zinc metalloproteinase nas-38-like n=1 Tax=Penaeus monodon TaxID=6687 RepID=UPI0018A787B2|nr:zinc metalloproteinase nas-38-like [Penaeus monodon]
MSGNSPAGAMRSTGLSLVLLTFVLNISLGLVRAEDAIDLEDFAVNMPLCPAYLPDDAPDEALELISTLSMDLLNPPVLNGSDILVEADVIMSQQQWDAMHAATVKGAPRKAIPWGFYRWPVSQSTGLPTATYRIDSSVRSPAMIRSAMNDWESHTCVRFVETSNINEPYINVLEDNGCYSYVGKTGTKGQKLSIGRGCYTAAIIRHELGHALGLFHEQTRADRDDYVQIFTENVRPGVEVNFQKEDNSVSYGQEYDFFSLMQYSSTAFTKNGGSTIVTLDPAMQIYLGQSDDLTFRDIAIVNHMYGCSDLWIASCSSSPPTCKNGGYLGANCACVCPAGTTGSSCETLGQDYFASQRGDCSEKITSPTTVTSPNYPNNYPYGLTCAKWIVAPECKLPRVTFTAFRLASCSKRWDQLEIRTNNRFDGNFYCGTEIAPGTSVTSTTNEIILMFYTRSNTESGWSADVTFVDDPNCNSATTTQAPTTQPPTTQAPTTQPPTTQTPTTQPPTTQAPTTQPPTTQAPTTQPPTTQAPTTQPPTTQAPTTQPSTTQAPTTQPPLHRHQPPASTTQAPTTQPPTTQAPTTQPPTTQAPTTQPPTTQAPTTEATSTEGPSTEAPTTQVSTTVAPTTEATTAPPSSPRCSLTSTAQGVSWRSPNFGSENYPNNFRCGLTGSAPSPYTTTFQLNTFQLQGKKRRRCVDFVGIQIPYNRTVKLCGGKQGAVVVPNLNINVSFVTDASKTDVGFDIGITWQKTGCHRVIELTEDDATGVIQSPRYPRKYKKNTVCEWWIVAPEGKRIQLDFATIRLRDKKCLNSYIAVDKSGSAKYFPDNSALFCAADRSANVISDGNQVNVAFAGGKRSKGFSARYTLV